MFVLVVYIVRMRLTLPPRIESFLPTGESPLVCASGSLTVGLCPQGERSTNVTTYFLDGRFNFGADQTDQLSLLPGYKT